MPHKTPTCIDYLQTSFIHSFFFVLMKQKDKTNTFMYRYNRYSVHVIEIVHFPTWKF